jgi:hypothetical protein
MNEMTKSSAKEQESEQAAALLKTQADTVIVSNKEEYDAALAVDKKAREAKRAFHEWFDPIDDASKKQRATTIAQGKKIDEPLDYVVKTISRKTSAWYSAEQARIRAEQKAAEDAARKAAEDAALMAAELLEKSGMTAAADAILETPVAVPKVEVPVFDKPEGISYRTQYSAEVISMPDLIRAVFEGKASSAYLMPNMTALNSWARGTKGADSIPGVKVVKETLQARKI